MRNLADDQREDGNEILPDCGEERGIHPTIGAQRSQVEALSPTRRMLVPFGERQEMLFQPSDLAWGQEGREARAAVIGDLAAKGRGGLGHRVPEAGCVGTWLVTIEGGGRLDIRFAQ